jgi:hypothetical protein
VQQQAVAGDEHEPQQRLDHVGVDHVRGAAEQRGHGHVDAVALEVEPEVAAELAEVLLVGDEARPVGDQRPGPQAPLTHRLDPDADVGAALQRPDPEVLELAELDVGPDRDEAAHLVQVAGRGRGGPGCGRGARPGGGGTDGLGGGRLPDEAVTYQEPQQKQDNQGEEVRNQVIDTEK